jgi:hypothetical protein
MRFGILMPAKKNEVSPDLGIASKAKSNAEE